MTILNDKVTFKKLDLAILWLKYHFGNSITDEYLEEMKVKYYKNNGVLFTPPTIKRNIPYLEEIKPNHISIDLPSYKR